MVINCSLHKTKTTFTQLLLRAPNAHERDMWIEALSIENSTDHLIQEKINTRVDESNVIANEWMNKQGEHAFSQWKRRFFVLTDRPRLETEKSVCIFIVFTQLFKKKNFSFSPKIISQNVYLNKSLIEKKKKKRILYFSSEVIWQQPPIGSIELSEATHVQAISSYDPHFPAKYRLEIVTPSRCAISFTRFPFFFFFSNLNLK